MLLAPWSQMKQFFCWQPYKYYYFFFDSWKMLVITLGLFGVMALIGIYEPLKIFPPVVSMCNRIGISITFLLFFCHHFPSVVRKFFHIQIFFSRSTEWIKTILGWRFGPSVVILVLTRSETIYRMTIHRGILLGTRYNGHLLRYWWHDTTGCSKLYTQLKNHWKTTIVICACL